MNQLMFILLLGLHAGKWFSLEFVGRCFGEIHINKRSVCNQTRFGEICLTTFFTNHRPNLPLRKSFEDASEFCRAEVPESTLVVIKNEDDQRMVESFINSQALGNETIITDARKLSDNDSWTWSWVNGDQTIPGEVKHLRKQFPAATGVALSLSPGTLLAYIVYNISSPFRYICEYSNLQSNFNYWQNNKSYVVSVSDATWYDARKECLRLGGDLASITNRGMIGNWSWLTENHKYWIGYQRNKWIWNNTGTAITYSNWIKGYPTESSDRQCICLSPQCNSTDNREKSLCRYWEACNCNNSYAVICKTEYLKSSSSTPVNTTTNSEKRSVSVAITSTSTKENFAKPNNTKSIAAKTTFNKTTATSITPSTHPVVDAIRTTTSEIPSISSTTQEPSVSDDYSTAVAAAEGGLFSSIGTKEIVILLLIFAAIVIIIVAVFLIIRKRKHDKLNAESITKNKEPSETVACVYATVVPDTKQSAEATSPPGNTIYAEVEMTQRAKPSNNATDSNVQPTDTANVMGGNVVYADLDLPQKGQQRIETVDPVTASPNPIQTQPSEPSTSPSFPVYAEPFKPDEKSETVAPVHSNDTINDQQTIPENSRDPAGKEVKATDSIYEEAIKVKPGAESGDVDIRDPSAIYAEPIKLKKPK